jgi:hypothetical protein
MDLLPLRLPADGGRDGVLDGLMEILDPIPEAANPEMFVGTSPQHDVRTTSDNAIIRAADCSVLEGSVSVLVGRGSKGRH